ncbi:MAG: hypothetical protein ACRDEB_02660, partial [Chitinophagaceae bacterium]
MRVMLINIFIVLWLTGNSQPQSVMPVDTTRESMKYWTKWLNDFYDIGVDQQKDSIFIKEEVIRLVKDSAYRHFIYPDKYEW